MNRGQIKTAIKNAVDDSTVDSAILNQWIQDADDAVQTWKPPLDQNQSFDWWDFLKDKKNYQSVSLQKYALPDNYRAFVELKIADDEDPYRLIDYRDREKYSDHAVYIYGKYFYVIAEDLESGEAMEFSFVRFTDEFASDNDEPEIERIYYQAYVEYGKKQYYSQQGDTELENKAEANFEKIMMKKWRDQELNRMATASDTAEISVSSIA